MKVKTIVNSRNDWFDDEINEFIQHEHVIDVKFNFCLGANNHDIYSALIMYEDIK